MTLTPTSADLSPAKFEISTVLEWEDWKHVVLPRLRASSRRSMPHLRQLRPHKGHALIVGGGPSATDYIAKIKLLSVGETATVFPINGAHQFLLSHGVAPNIHVLFEHDVDKVVTALGGLPHLETVYYVASHCNPSVFRELKGNRCVLWHAFLPLEEYQDTINHFFPGEFMVSGGYATFFKTLTIAILLGYRNFDLFGVDSSFDTNSHLDGYRTFNVEETINIWGSDPNNGTMRKFTSYGGLAFQANEFINFCGSYHKDISMRVHGDSLLRYLHETRYPEQYKF